MTDTKCQPGSARLRPATVELREKLIDVLWDALCPGIRQSEIDREYYGRAVDHVLRHATKAIIEQCAKIADPWPGFNVGQKISEPDISVIEVRRLIAATIRRLSLPLEQRGSK